MAREKQFVFSARTTGEGLKALNQVKARANMGWDEMVIEAVSAHYHIDKTMMTLPKKEAPIKSAENEPQQPPTEETAPEQPAIKEERPAKKQKKTGKKANKAEASQ